MTTDTQLILASTSPYRKELLARLRLPFTICAPDFDEAAPHSMPPIDLVRHNTLGKAHAVSALHPDANVIAADQLAVCGDITLGKPGNHDAACAQLSLLSGKSVDFITGVALHCGDKRRDEAHYAMVPFRVCFRNLSAADIETYLHAEQPYDCAGSFKAEALGIVLFKRTCGDDPTALTGLPLITLAGWLKPLQTAI